MNDYLFSSTPAEYFRDLVHESVSRQKVRASELTIYYVYDLLCSFVQPGRRTFLDFDKPLALQLAKAIEKTGFDQFRLRALGDLSLFVSGFFSDSLKRWSVDVDYYSTMGSQAYGMLGRYKHDDVFAELAEKFVSFMDVLADVRHHTKLASDLDILRIYEKWLRTGSLREAEKLIEHGITPNRSVGRKFIQ